MNGWTSRAQVRDEAARRCLEWNKIKKKKKKNEVGRRREGGGQGWRGIPPFTSIARRQALPLPHPFLLILAAAAGRVSSCGSSRMTD